MWVGNTVGNTGLSFPCVEEEAEHGSPSFFQLGQGRGNWGRVNNSCVSGEAPSKTLVETAKEATEKAKETALAATEKAKDLATKAATKKKQFV